MSKKYASSSLNIKPSMDALVISDGQLQLHTSSKNHSTFLLGRLELQTYSRGSDGERDQILWFKAQLDLGYMQLEHLTDKGRNLKKFSFGKNPSTAIFWRLYFIGNFDNVFFAG